MPPPSRAGGSPRSLGRWVLGCLFVFVFCHVGGGPFVSKVDETSVLWRLKHFFSLFELMHEAKRTGHWALARFEKPPIWLQGFSQERQRHGVPCWVVVSRQSDPSCLRPGGDPRRSLGSRGPSPQRGWGAALRRPARGHEPHALGLQVHGGGPKCSARGAQ